MKCRDYEARISIWARQEFVDASSEQGLAHAAACHRCATRLHQERDLSYGVRSVMAALAREEPSPQVEAALLRAFNDQFATSAAVKLTAPVARRRRALPLGLAFGMSVMLILVLIPSLVSIPSLVWRSSPSVTPVASVKPEAHGQYGSNSASVLPMVPPMVPPVVPAAAGETGPRHAVAIFRRPKAVPRAVVKPQNAIAANPTEEVTAFFPLADGEDLTSLDAAQIARVELPVSALMDLGLRVGPEISLASKVKADILMSYDGSARAIRFVR